MPSTPTERNNHKAADRLATALMRQLGGRHRAAEIFLHHAEQFSRAEKTTHYAPPLRQAVNQMLRSLYEGGR